MTQMFEGLILTLRKQIQNAEESQRAVQNSEPDCGKNNTNNQ